MKFWQSSWFHTVLHIIGVAGTVLTPVLAATGVGIPAAVVAGAATVGGVALKLTQSPITLDSAVDTIAGAVKK